MPIAKTTITTQPQTNQFSFHADANGSACRIDFTTDDNGNTKQLNLVSPVHGQVSLPVIGGIAQSQEPGSDAQFAEYFQHGPCATTAKGSLAADTAETEIHSHVSNLRVINQPLPKQKIEADTIEFQADLIQLGIQSTYQRGANPVFTLLESDPVNMRIVYKMADKTSVFPVVVTIDPKLIGNSAAPASIVTVIKRGDMPVEPGHVLTIPGFGKLYFGEVVASQFSRRVIMLRIALGCRTTGSVSLASVGQNGV